MAEIHNGVAFVQVGFTALRDPATGDFLPAEPLYKKVPAAVVDKRTDLAACEMELCKDIGTVFAEKFGQYVNGCRAAEKKLNAGGSQCG